MLRWQKLEYYISSHAGYQHACSSTVVLLSVCYRKVALNVCGCLVCVLFMSVVTHMANSPFQVLVPSGIFDMDKLMAALAYQVDPQAVDVENYTMFRPRKKTGVLSSR